MKHVTMKLAAAAVAVALTGCATHTPLVSGPVIAAPLPMPMTLERVNNGSIFQAGMASAALFSGEVRPRSVGDSLKIDIAETVRAKREVNTDTSRENAVASKGPGSKSASGVLGSLLNLDASASGSDSFKGAGTTGNSSSFTGQLAASVINVLPNGHLVVAGERSVAMNGGTSTLRFSGIVNPRDIRPGNIVASGDAVNARVELVGQGDVSEAATRNWLQRVLTSSMTVW
ncbi:flagellar basal body L-ring protein FlgH [Rhizobacter sp. Root1221]|uniref:flagellar basal body L-ring protein FlgH n=1 Tax=Rhizobacter sp. Root1221 TaxID=1736433 RepID=UPI0006FDAAE6|nr:flagellar basal body L-ring protein FlgH [Rhizobacter sp. Root1221]KQV97236.1 flagellar biosynthesis protein FlgH [Rhizobacter sp. Root1221]